MFSRGLIYFEFGAMHNSVTFRTKISEKCILMKSNFSLAMFFSKIFFLNSVSCTMLVI